MIDYELLVLTSFDVIVVNFPQTKDQVKN